MNAPSFWPDNEHARCFSLTNKGRRCKLNASTEREHEGAEYPVCSHHTHGRFRPDPAAIGDHED